MLISCCIPRLALQPGTSTFSYLVTRSISYLSVCPRTSLFVRRRLCIWTLAERPHCNRFPSCYLCLIFCKKVPAAPSLSKSPWPSRHCFLFFLIAQVNWKLWPLLSPTDTHASLLPPFFNWCSASRLDCFECARIDSWSSRTCLHKSRRLSVPRKERSSINTVM